MAIQLDYNWDKEWMNGNLWVAVAGDDFPQGQEEYFQIFLKDLANEHNLWAKAWPLSLRGLGKVVVNFRFEERNDDETR